ncbi:MAG: hypothetical protein ACK48X_10785, partial [Planctomycetota bacterium]
PNLEVLEDRLCLWEGAEMAGVFSAGPRASPRFSSALTPRRHVAEPDCSTSVPSLLLSFLSRVSRQPPV